MNVTENLWLFNSIDVTKGQKADIRIFNQTISKNNIIILKLTGLRLLDKNIETVEMFFFTA
jgi:hypothetical protein